MEFIKTTLLGILLLVGSVSWTQEELQKPYEFEQLHTWIQEVFPEAYVQFTEITFSRSSNFIFPDRATILIPHRYFKEKGFICNFLRLMKGWGWAGRIEGYVTARGSSVVVS